MELSTKLDLTDKIMSNTELAKFLAVAASDVLAAFLPGGGTASHIFTKYIEKRRHDSHEIIVKELTNGFHGPVEFDNLDIDPIISMMLRISKAISDGTAMNNIRFLAQVIAGLKKNRQLTEDIFLSWARIVENLTRDEILLLGLAHVCSTEVTGPTEEVRNSNFWDALKSRADAAGFTLGDLHSTCTSLARTGLVVPLGSFGPAAYTASPSLAQLASLIDILSEGTRRHTDRPSL